MTTRTRIILVVVVVLIALGGAGWYFSTLGQESTDDAQVDAHVTPIASRVGGTILGIPVVDNQEVEAGAVLAEIDRRDYEVALDHARADLADVEAAATAANVSVPITSTTTASGVQTAQGGVDRAAAGIAEAELGVESAKARQASVQAHQRELDAEVTRATKDADRLKSLLAKDEVPQQQVDAAVAQAEVAHAASDAGKAQQQEAAQGIKVAESRLQTAKVSAQQAGADLSSARTGPQQVAAMRAKAASAAAQVKLKQAAVRQAELNLEYTTVKAPVKGIVSRKSVETGQVVQPGQPLMTVIPLDRVWITANFKETQLSSMRVGQRVSVDVDAYSGREFNGKIESIAAATGSRFSLLPPENATGNFVKVVQRVPVKIVLESGQDAERLLRPGMSVTPTVHTK